MNTQIPESLSCTFQPLDWQGSLYQSFTLGLGFNLSTGVVLPPNVTWGAAMKALDENSTLDMGVPKKQAEWLLAGKAYAPKDTKVKSLVLDLQVGSTSRRLLVESDQPFEALPLSWQNTWGTPEENPTGLPTTQLKRAPVTDATLPFGTPACPGPRGAWPCRMPKLGSYDLNWLKTRWPGVPDDFDWAFYNLAQPKQRLPEGLTGKEAFTLTNLHPLERHISGHLPGKTLRLFVQKQGKWLECVLNLDTLWLFPNQLTGLLLWHALVKCQDESGSDLEIVRVEMLPEEKEENAKEAKVAPKTQEEKVTPKVDPLKVKVPKVDPLEVKAPKVDPLKAQAPKEDFLKTQAPTPNTSLNYEALFTAELDKNLKDINAGLAEAGFHPLTEAQIAETRKRLAAMGRQYQDMEAQMAKTPEPELKEVLRKAGVKDSQIKNLKAALDLPNPDPSTCKTPKEWHALIETYLAKFTELLHPSQDSLNSLRTTLRLKGPGAEELEKKMAASFSLSPKDSLLKAGMKPDQATRFLELLEEDMPIDPDGIKNYATQLEKAGGFPKGSVANKLAAYEEALKKAGMSLPQAEPISIPKPKKEPPTPKPVEEALKKEELCPPTDRQTALAWLASGRSLAGLDLSGVDLSRLNLSGQNLEGVKLNGGSLKGSKLEGANLTSASLKQTDCTEAIFSLAQLKGATLEGTLADRALFWQCDLTGVKAKDIKAKEADFSKAKLDQAVLENGSFIEANFEEAQGQDLKASQANFQKANLQECSFPKAILTQANLSQAFLYKCKLDKANLREALLDKASFSQGTSVVEADLTGASLKEGVWTKVTAKKAIFTGCQASKASFNDGDYTASVWRGADLREGDFSRSCLNGAELEGANLFKGSLREAKLLATNLGKTNLYGVDLTRSQTDLATILDGSDLTNTILAAKGKAK